MLVFEGKEKKNRYEMKQTSSNQIIQKKIYLLIIFPSTVIKNKLVDQCAEE